MKPWIQRSLLSLFGGAIALSSLSACSSYRHGGRDGDTTEFRARMVERVGGKLDLDAVQKQKLMVLADRLQAQRQAMRGAGGAGEPRSQFRALFAGPTLDQAGAAKLIEEKTAVLRSGSPEVSAAAADFFDHLNAEQQQKVRDFMDRGGRRWGRT